MSESSPENENAVGDNSINEPNTPGQERTVSAEGLTPSTVVTATAPLAEPQKSDDPGVQGAIDAVQEAQNVADQHGHFGVRADPRPLEDYSVEGSVARAEAGDTTSLPQAE